MSSDGYQPFVMPDLAELSPAVTGCHQPVATLSPPENDFPDWGKGADYREFERSRAKTVTIVTTFSGGLPWDDGLNRLFALPRPRYRREETWLELLFDCERFYNDWGSKALALEWPETELFGCHRDPSLRRVDNNGLLISLHGRRVLAMDAQSAKIDAGRGDVLTYYCGFPLERSVPLWVGFSMGGGP